MTLNLRDKRAFDQLGFFATAFSAAVAGQYSHAQLKNPAASARVMIVRRVTIGSPTAGGAFIANYDTNLTTLVASAINNKRIAAAGTSVGEMRTQSNVAQLFTKNLFNIPIEANASIAVPQEVPILLEPGRGLVVVHFSVNAGVYANFEFEELFG